MKRKGLITATLLFFLLINTAYYWEADLGVFAMLSTLAMICYFFVLVFMLLGQLFFASKEKFADRQRIYLVGGMTIVLLLAFLYPRGIINFEKLEGDTVLIAQNEGAANCTTTLKLRHNKKFVQQSSCFGLSEVTGTYQIKGDTIIFENVSPGRNSTDFYKCAVLTKGSVHLLRSSKDTTWYPLAIIKNDM